MRCWLIVLVLLPGPALAEWYRDARDMMGTRVSVELWADSAEQGNAAINDAMAAMAEVNRLMNPWDEASELSAVNRSAASKPVPLSAWVYDVVHSALEYSRLSGGAFDISFASAGQYYDYRAGVAPNASQLAAAIPSIDYRSLLLDSEKRSLAFRRDGVRVDLGGIAKGFAVDRAIDAVQSHGVESAVISAGGDSRILGNLGDRPRTIGIRHPRKAGEFAVMIPLEDTAISTSGDYERFFIADDGRRVHHILDPATGKSAGFVQSASILAPLAVDSDALSTTVFVLGVDAGLAMVNRLPEIEAIVIDDAGRLHFSAGLLRESP
ncbi:MAG: FAD:protein FMN transferase [Pseudomonadota bacterium]